MPKDVAPNSQPAILETICIIRISILTYKKEQFQRQMFYTADAVATGPARADQVTVRCNATRPGTIMITDGLDSLVQTNTKDRDAHLADKRWN